ncbi:amidohydrolase family protein [Corynebacterium flavescens]|uniref:amidohydrolase family protein n=1 Tax=Corynebacterium flavescens TaxID=28028 RepID=UPI002649B4C2|nr:amidohydrolase family protein [Corynebacterium flavescens]MDN6486515.1 amidohydrolase family protein [Ancrocorticia sp.]MDN6521837.1 amidohydrolase family protein [Bifidobacterium crudilactis]MDN6236116.1 amidohydrolase family protein [Corynebacterium flavescens]MDN6552856.1 amidohydrolase family protein [Corynebacterium flavescens]MDN6647259.1 amidohydrolase family protein [Corynebacterium flavescens]
MLIRNAQIRSESAGQLVDIRIDDGRITWIRPAGDAAVAGVDSQAHSGQGGRSSQSGEFGEVVDVAGKFVAPQLVESHIHLDYAFSAGTPRDNESGTLFEAIEIWRERKQLGLGTAEEVRAKAIAAARSAASHGVGFIRTHVDVTDPELVALGVLVDVKKEVADFCQIEIVAFPQNGMYAYPGGDELVERALREGADVVGAIPHLEPTREDGVASLKHAFDLAEKFGARVDVHCDEIDDEQSRFVEVMAAEATKRSMQGLTNVSHAVAMSYYTPGFMARLLPKMQAAQLSFSVCPNENLHLQGRGFSNPVPRGVAPVKQLVDFGLNVAFCQDSISDPWYPMGNGDLVRIIDTGLHVGHMLTPAYVDTCLDFATTNPAQTLGLSDYGIAEGKRANLVVFEAGSEREILQESAPVLLSIHDGRTVFERPSMNPVWRL